MHIRLYDDRQMIKELEKSSDPLVEQQKGMHNILMLSIHAVKTSKLFEGSCRGVRPVTAVLHTCTDALQHIACRFLGAGGHPMG